ncbi:hypothetical protein BJX62DRAFT_243757 [Aspergillus germanicus]
MAICGHLHSIPAKQYNLEQLCSVDMARPDCYSIRLSQKASVPPVTISAQCITEAFAAPLAAIQERIDLQAHWVGANLKGIILVGELMDCPYVSDSLNETYSPRFRVIQGDTSAG